MCGILGYIGKNIPENLPLNVLKHRGPDANGVWTNNKNCILGHTRLSIIDLNTRSNQPMTDMTDRYTIIYNGEIYNYIELKKTYLSNIKLKTSSDTEVLLALWSIMGNKCIKLLRGMFAFAIWDEKYGKLFLVRDRYGQKPLFYFIEDGSISFSSELNALKKLHIDLSIYPEAIDLFLGHQFIPTPHTIYKNVFKLPPGSFATWENRMFKINKYYNLTFNHKQNKKLTEFDAKIILENKIRESVKLRLRSDVPVGSLLSGGVDSSLVTAIAAQESNKPLKTFSIGFDENELSELKYAKIVSERYHTDHTEYIFTELEAIDLLNKSIVQYGEPFGDKSSLPSLLVCSIAGKELKVALNGDGGDELFAGYSKYNLDIRNQLLGLLPFQNTSFYNKMNDLEFFLLSKNSGLNHLTSKIIDHINPLTAVTRFNEFFRLSDMVQLYRKDFFHQVVRTRKKHVTSLISDLPSEIHILNKLLFVDYKHYFADDLLVKMDIASMAYGLEMRSPLMDSTLMELVASFPIRFKQNRGNGKYLLKKLAESYIPNDLIYRKKQGFSIPVSKWLNGILLGPLTDILHTNNNMIWEYLEREAVIKMFNGGRGINSNPYRFWVLLILALWFDQNK